MSELKNGPFISKLVQPEKLDEEVFDPLAYCSGRELGKFNEEIELTALKHEGTILGRPSSTTISGEELRTARKLNYKNVNTETGFYSLQEIETDDKEYSGKRLPTGAVLIGRMRPYINNITALDPNLVNSQMILSDSEWLIFQPSDNLVYFWLLVMRTTNILRQFSVTRGQTRPRLHEDDLEEISVPVVPKKHRKRINMKRQNLFRDLQQIEQDITDTSQQLEDYFDSNGVFPEF